MTSLIAKPTTFVTLPGLEGEHICSTAGSTEAKPQGTYLRLHYVDGTMTNAEWIGARVIARGEINGEFEIVDFDNGGCGDDDSLLRIIVIPTA